MTTSAERGSIGHRYAHALEDLVLVGGDRCEGVGRLPERHAHVDAAIREMAGGDEAPTAVAAGSGEHRDGLRGESFDDELCEVAAGVLHHLDQLDPQVLDHHAIDFNHLRLGQPTDVTGCVDRIRRAHDRPS